MRFDSDIYHEIGNFAALWVFLTTGCSVSAMPDNKQCDQSDQSLQNTADL